MDNVPPYLQQFISDEDGDGNGEDSGGWDGCHFQLREYEVERFEEPCLFSGLVTLQLGILRAFLQRLRGVPEDLGGEYFVLLDVVDKRVMKLGRFCSASCEV